MKVNFRKSNFSGAVRRSFRKTVLHEECVCGGRGGGEEGQTRIERPAPPLLQVCFRRRRCECGFRTTVLSGARGLDGRSLDCSYFSRLQPRSFLFFNQSSSHAG